MAKIHPVKSNSNQTELKKNTDTFQKRQRETLKVLEKRLKVRHTPKYVEKVT